MYLRQVSTRGLAGIQKIMLAPSSGTKKNLQTVPM